MYNKTKCNKTVIRRDNKAGEFTTIHHSILNDKRLTPTAFKVLMSILSDADTFKLTYKLIENRLGISENTVRGAFKLLIKCGYMRKIKNQYGRGNLYTISEYGNLNSDKSNNDMESSSIPNVCPPPITKEVSQERNQKNMALFEMYIKSISEFLEIDSVWNKLTELREQYIVNGIVDYYPLKRELDKEILIQKKLIYKACMQVTENIGGNTSKKAITEYSNWLKEQVFDKHDLSFDFRKKWTYIKMRHQSFKTDYETELADRREQDYEDMY